MKGHQEFGQAIRQFRQSLGLTTRELAERARLSHPMIVKTERGERAPSFATAFKLTGALGLADKARMNLLQKYYPSRAGDLAEYLVMEILREAGFEVSRERERGADITAELGGGAQLLVNVQLRRRGSRRQ
jgi:transcriptional regulator with XRE-family HTH domain